MKIILDSSAVEKLIGGNSEVEVELRSAIIQSFAKRYLKGVIDKDYIDTISEEFIKSLYEVQPS